MCPHHSAIFTSFGPGGRGRDPRRLPGRRDFCCETHLASWDWSAYEERTVLQAEGKLVGHQPLFSIRKSIPLWPPQLCLWLSRAGMPQEATFSASMVPSSSLGSQSYLLCDVRSGSAFLAPSAFFSHEEGVSLINPRARWTPPPTAIRIPLRKVRMNTSRK